MITTAHGQVIAIPSTILGRRGSAKGLPRRLLKMVAGHRPDVVLMGGWAERPYRELVWNERIE